MLFAILVGKIFSKLNRKCDDELVTIKDVAKKAEVSSATVSRVLNKDYTLQVSEDTRQRIIAAAKALGYQKGGTHSKRLVDTEIVKKNVGLLITCSEQLEFSDPYFLSIRQGIEQECVKQNINVSKIFRLMDESELAIDSYKLDGLIIIGKVHNELLNHLTRMKQVISIDYMIDDKFDSVMFDLQKATRQAIQHLINLGHRKIGYIGGISYIRKISGRCYATDIRQVEYEAIMKEAGYYNPKHVFVGEWRTEEGYALMRQALEQDDRPTAYLIGSDPMAIAALRAVSESKFKVPEDIAIVSFDDITLASFVTPPLTTIKIFSEEMGRTAVKLMVDRFNGRVIPLHVTIPTNLVIRNSCGSESGNTSIDLLNSDAKS
ncbi:LacI family DNA-binding transcriptional regulator [Paenibacillus pseudetheri]|uniref:HTH-type transcriptional repressor MelR n=1 Tax=Paenibacillus pseudetheri TaxID=2897682 RepID=A0ABN8FHQ1_9BACL|nr:LacI family DNA-binding transcriptional regulator [Paenibacillus pseudetheri]CAH1054971.1 HTH-type transcriptional repressor MelR [Paenibacillus pseudetheri]